MLRLSLVMLCFVAFFQTPHARAVDSKGTWSFAYENDIFAGSDNRYTNGVRLAYATPENRIPAWLDTATDWFPLFKREGEERLVYALGQSMFTPDDITVRPLIQDQRPYAGWLYGSASLTSDTKTRLDKFRLQLGIVGSYSFAEEVQTFVHREITNSPIPEGWDHQLNNEPGFVLTYERTWKQGWQGDMFGFEADLVPHAGLALGNVFTYANGGLTLRFGQYPPEDYGPARVPPGIAGSDFFTPGDRDIGWYVFAGVEGRAIARNMFLDGNSFTDSHSVDKQYVVGDVQLGLSITWNPVRFGYTHVFRSEEYRGQVGGDQFGALTISFLY